MLAQLGHKLILQVVLLCVCVLLLLAGALGLVGWAVFDYLGRSLSAVQSE